jgi:HK97 family phage portal protein
MKIFRRVSKVAAAAMKLFSNSSEIWTDWNSYAKYYQEGYIRNPQVSSCIDRRADALSTVPFKLYELKSDGTKGSVVHDHPLSHLLKQPNPSQTFSSFISLWLTYMNISGNAFIEKITLRNGEPGRLELHRPDKIRLVPGKFGIVGYRYEALASSLPNTSLEYILSLPSDAKSMEREAKDNNYAWAIDEVSGMSEIIHSMYRSPINDFYGLSPIEKNGRIIDIFNNYDQWTKRFLDNNCSPPFFLMAKGIMPQKNKDSLIKYMRQNSGSLHAGEPFILEGDVEVKELGNTPRETEYLKGRHVVGSDICNNFKVDPVLNGIGGNSTFSNKKEATIGFWEGTVTYDATFLKGELNRALLPDFKGKRSLIIDFDLSDVPALISKRANNTELTLKCKNILTPNEMRARIGYDSIGKKGDEIFVPKTQYPLEFQANAENIEAIELSKSEPVEVTADPAE